MNNNLTIAGCNFIGLYSAIKCTDNGYNVTIIEKKKHHIMIIKIITEFLIKIIIYI